MNEPTIITTPKGTRYTVTFTHEDDGRWLTKVRRVDRPTVGCTMWSADEGEGRRLHWWITTLMLRGDAEFNDGGRFGWRKKLRNAWRVLTFQAMPQERAVRGAFASGVFRDTTKPNDVQTS